MNKTERIKSLKAAGLGTALNESGLGPDCKKNHSIGAKRGWKFCPHCGDPLTLLNTCSICKHNFYSMSAWKVHIAGHTPTCPECKIKTSLQKMPKGLKYKSENLSPVGHGSKFHCLKCGTLFVWNFNGAKRIVVMDSGPNLLMERQVIFNGK